MPQAAEQTASEVRPLATDDGYRGLLLAALRVARVKLRTIQHEIDDIGIDLQSGRLTPDEAMRLCVHARIDVLFPSETD